MLFQVGVKFGTAQCCICLPSILLTPLAPIHGNTGWFLIKCILQHSSLLAWGCWVYGWSSYTGLIRSHPSSWTSLGLVLFWPELILEEWELHGGGSQFNTQGGCIRPLQLSEGTGELNTKPKPKLSCIVRWLYSMENVCKSTVAR